MVIVTRHENNDLVSLDGFSPLQLSALHEIPENIQYACGLNAFDNWLNVDFFDDALIWNFTHIGGVPRKVAEKVYQINLLDRHPFPDGTFQYAFSEDFIEHLDQKNAILFLEEVFRTLKPGGVLRITSPGLQEIMNNHFCNASYEQVIENHEAAYTRWGHLHFFTHDSLRTIALGLGFQKYTICDFHKSEHAQLRDLETRSEQAEYKVNIYAEITK